MSAALARGQDLVPGAYTPAPVGINAVTVAANVNDGGIAFDSSVPVEDGQATLSATALAYNRTLSVAGRSAIVAAGIPYVFGDLSGVVLGQFQQTSRAGFGDLAMRVAVNLFGAPAMTRRQYATYSAKTIVGVSLAMSAPVGQYDNTRYINIGSNRWAFKPELGLFHRWGRWTVEGDFGGSFFTDNPDFRRGGLLQQAPIWAVQGHLIYTIRPGFWVAGDGNFWNGGRITINGVPGASEQRNSRTGITLAVPIGRQQLRFAYSFGAYTTIGGDFHSFGASYSYAWVRAPARPAGGGQ